MRPSRQRRGTRLLVAALAVVVAACGTSESGESSEELVPPGQEAPGDDAPGETGGEDSPGYDSPGEDTGDDAVDEQEGGTGDGTGD